jgi:heat-inducible transcriptional repressor
MSASPVGSRFISKRDDFNLSSATIRNEMADLEELGYLEQPHTSAGRIPSDKAYRLYVDHMLNRAELSSDEIKVIRSHMSGRIDEVESIIKQTAQALSSVTNYTAMVLPPMLAATRLKHMQLLPLHEGRALLVVITNNGFAKDAVIRIPDDMRYEELERISNMLTKRYVNCRMDELGERIVHELGEELFERRQFLNTMVEAIERKVSPAAVSVELSGATNMLHYPEYSDVNKAKTFLTAVEGRDTLYRMLKRASQLEFSITIGSENESESLKDCSIVTATYRVGGEPMGSFGIIGPTRMQYGKVISVLEFMRMSLGEILGNLLEEEKH